MFRARKSSGQGTLSLATSDGFGHVQARQATRTLKERDGGRYAFSKEPPTSCGWTNHACERTNEPSVSDHRVLHNPLAL